MIDVTRTHFRGNIEGENGHLEAEESEGWAGACVGRKRE
jgi:hypothetical protein